MSDRTIKILAATTVLFLASFVASRQGSAVGLSVAIVGLGVGYRRVLLGLVAAFATALASAYAPAAVAAVVLIVSGVVLLITFAVQSPEAAGSAVDGGGHPL